MIDEIHTPDSSRYWYRDTYEQALAQGRDPQALDKEYLRRWLVEQGWRGEGDAAAAPRRRALRGGAALHRSLRAHHGQRLRPGPRRRPSSASAPISGSERGVAAAAAQPASAEVPVSPGYARYVLGLLFVVYVFNFVDRQILAILLEPIKQDLGVSDTAMGFLTGFAFAVFYTFAGIPIARFADRGVRRSVIAVGAALWSAMTAASGLAQSFAQLALARVGVGIGEAACSPPAHSLLSDYFPPERRATALAIYAAGHPLRHRLRLPGRRLDQRGLRLAHRVLRWSVCRASPSRCSCGSRCASPSEVCRKEGRRARTCPRPARCCASSGACAASATSRWRRPSPPSPATASRAGRPRS